MYLKTIFAAVSAMLLLLAPMSASAAESTAETTAVSSEAAETTASSETEETEETTASSETEETEETTTSSETEETAVTSETEDTTVTEPVLSGLVQGEDGNWYYYSNGVFQTGVFSAIPDYPVGDIEGNGAADAADASLILNAAAQEGVEGVSAAELLMAFAPELSEEEICRYADIGADGRIDAQDAAEILSYAAKIGADEEPLPLGYAVYYADASGVLQTGWITGGNGDTYYAGENFRLYTGWVQYEGLVYYFTESGVMVTGWQEVDGNTCYFHTDGSAAQGVTELGDAVYLFNDCGVMQTGWQKLEGETYYFAEDGGMVTGWQEVDGNTCYFHTDGSAAQGVTELGNAVYLFNDCGVMQTGWQKLEGETYYFAEDGVMCTGIMEIDGVKERFNTDGVYNPLKICLDAGHYAKYNRSPVNSAYWESEMTWKLHLYLKAELEEYGIEVITTREKQEVDLALEERGKTAKGCDLFLSLHSDAANNSSLDMPTAYCTITEEVNPLGTLLADKVHEVMGTKQEGGIRNRVGDNGDYYGVLRGAASVGVPGILMEHSYHTNLRSTNWLLVDSNLQKLAEAEAALISDYYLN